MNYHVVSKLLQTCLLAFKTSYTSKQCSIALKTEEVNRHHSMIDVTRHIYHEILEFDFRKSLGNIVPEFLKFLTILKELSPYK